MKSLSVIILTYNSEKDIYDCLKLVCVCLGTLFLLIFISFVVVCKCVKENEKQNLIDLYTYQLDEINRIHGEVVNNLMHFHYSIQNYLGKFLLHF